MDRPVLVPLDGSRRAERALPHALALAKASGASIHLARVHADPPLFGVSSISAEALAGWESDVAAAAARAEAYLHDTATRLQAALGTGRVRVTLLREDPDVVRALAQLAGHIHAGSIVIASRDRSPFARLAWFSVADGLIRRSGVPVMVITDRTGPRPMPASPRILLPAADVAENEAALVVAADFARACGARVTLARVIVGAAAEHVLPVGSLDAPPPAAALEDLVDAARITGSIADLDVKLLRHHDRVEAILHAAEEVQADMIVMPTRRRGGLEVLLGSTASGVLRRAEIPVVIIGTRAVPADARSSAGLVVSAGEEEPALFV